MSVSIFSYRDEVTIGLMVDAAIVPDPQAIIDALEPELDQLGALSPVPATAASRSAPALRPQLSDPAPEPRHFAQRPSRVASSLSINSK